MTVTDFYTEFGYTELIDVRKAHQKIDVDEFYKLGVDKVHFSGDFPAIFFKEIKQFDERNLNEIAQIQHLAWNYRKVMFLFVLSTTEIRIYNCNKKPFNYKSDEIKFEEELKNLELISSEFRDKNNIRIIKELFSRVSVDCGILWTTDNSLREKIDVQKRIDRYLVKSLVDAAKEIKKLGLDEDIIHSLLMRSIFIMYLEDKGAANETNLYTEINEKARSYLDILENKNDTYKLFDKLEKHFNGNVFPLIRGEKRKVTRDHLKVIQKCLLDGDLSDDPKLFTWRLFRFNVIQIELLSEIYENFLGELKSNKRVQSGQYYTPPSLVELILNEKLKVTNERVWEFKVLDPACGSGIFLVESFNRLVKRWKNANKDQKIKFSDLKKILTNNIFGIEYDKYAIRVAAFSLYLAIVEHLNPKTLWNNKNYKFPYLINDPQDSSLETQGKNLFRADTIGEITGKEFPKADLVIGNPPFGSRFQLKSIKDFCKKFEYGQDMVIPFLRKAIDFTENGQIALIFNSKVLTNTGLPFQNFRRWLFNDNYVEKIFNLSIFRKAPKTFGGKLFTSAVGPVSIIFYQKETPRKSLSTIEYWAPKTYVKNNLFEGIVTESMDIKYLPREECQKPDTNIWKIALWGSFEDFKLINQLTQKHDSIRNYFKDKFNLDFGVGLELSDPRNKYNSKIKKLLHHKPQTLRKYYTDNSYCVRITNTYFRRLGKIKAYAAPHVLIKEGLESNKIISSFIDYDCTFYKGIIGAYSKTRDSRGLKILNSYINSNFIRYLAFLMTSSWGIERDIIKYKELFSLPYVLADEDDAEKRLEKISDDAANQLRGWYEQDSANIDFELDKIIFSHLNEDARILVEDALNYSLDLFHLGYKSKALKGTNRDIDKDYAECLLKKMYDFLGKENRKDLNISVTIFVTRDFHPLNLTTIQFGVKTSNIKETSINTIEHILADIDKIIIKREAKSIYVRKQIKFFDHDRIYIIKPNQRRLWTRSAAMNDAKDLIGEILKM